MKTIVLADDHAILRQALRPMLEQEFGLQVIAEATTGREAVNVVRDQRPDIVIMDIAMSDMNGIEATHRISQQFPAIKVLVLTTFDDDEWLFDALRAGAAGY